MALPTGKRWFRELNFVGQEPKPDQLLRELVWFYGIEEVRTDRPDEGVGRLCGSAFLGLRTCELRYWSIRGENGKCLGMIKRHGDHALKFWAEIYHLT